MSTPAHEIVDAPDENPELRGTITAAVEIGCSADPVLVRRPPIEHPAWDSALITPAHLLDSAGLVIARELPKETRR